MQNPVKFNLPQEVSAVWRAAEKLREIWPQSKRTFTPDGKLVGDIGEALAAYHFDLVICEKRERGIDARTNDSMGRSVQVKTTAIPTRGPAYSGRISSEDVDGSADYLIFLVLDIPGGFAEVLYNGPEERVRKELKPQTAGTQTVSSEVIKRLNEGVEQSQALPVKRP